MTLFAHWWPFRRAGRYALYDVAWDTRELLLALHRKVDGLRMTEQELEAKVQKLSDDVAGAVSSQQAATAALKAEIAALQAGSPVSQDQLDALGAKVDAIDAAIAPLVPAQA